MRFTLSDILCWTTFVAVLIALAKFVPIVFFMLVTIVFLYAILGPVVIIGSTLFFAQPRGNQLDPSTDPFHVRLLKLWIISMLLFVAMIVIMFTSWNIRR